MNHIVGECLAMMDSLIESIQKYVDGGQVLKMDKRSKSMRILLKASPSFAMGIQWFLSVVFREFLALHDVNRSTHFVVAHDNICAGIASCIKGKKWQRGFECLLSFVVDMSKAVAHNLPYQMTILNAKESSRMFLDLTEYVKYFCQPDQVFEHLS